MSDSKKQPPRRRALGRPPKAKPGAPGLREKIMAEAVRVFSQKGIAASGLKEISLAAGATPAVIYYHFQSREKLITETLDAHFLPLLLRVWAVVDEFEDPLEMVAEMQRRLIANALESPWFIPLWSREFVNAGGGLRDYAAGRLPAGFLKRFLAKIKKGQQEGRINPAVSPEMLYMSIIGETLIPLRSLSSWALLFDRKIKTETVIRHVEAMLAHGYKGQEK